AAEGSGLLEPITTTGDMRLSDIIGYESQKARLRENTEAFVSGRRANNVLLYGDAGTGKSTSIKAILNEFYDRGLRMIEIYKHEFQHLSRIIAEIKNRNYRFIIYMDDLSFEEFEIEYKYLKAVIEGGLEVKPDNVLIYATSNRRHLIRETWKDRPDAFEEDMHQNDTVQEKLSLAERFGLSIGYFRPDQAGYFDIVKSLARRHPEIRLTDEELEAGARRWEMGHSGISGRTAQQYINSLLGKQE
ncbi:MAG: ATP-binding protein, partial [Selenomonadaceae bacterium]|nr:ATP-binding protein [Selenomonadaceae bacterium]